MGRQTTLGQPDRFGDLAPSRSRRRSRKPSLRESPLPFATAAIGQHSAHFPDRLVAHLETPLAPPPWRIQPIDEPRPVICVVELRQEPREASTSAASEKCFTQPIDPPMQFRDSARENPLRLRVGRSASLRPDIPLFEPKRNFAACCATANRRRRPSGISLLYGVKRVGYFRLNRGSDEEEEWEQSLRLRRGCRKPSGWSWMSSLRCKRRGGQSLLADA
jgi:hypothetical protein